MRLLSCGFVNINLESCDKSNWIEAYPSVPSLSQLEVVWGGAYITDTDEHTHKIGNTAECTGVVVSSGDTTVITRQASTKDRDSSVDSSADRINLNIFWNNGSNPYCLTVDKHNHIACSRHSVAIATSEDIQVINADETNREYRLEYPLPLGVTKLALGGEFIVATTTPGLVWSWGNNNHGQLGLGHVQKVLEPTPIDYLHGLKVVDVSAGLWHVLAKTEFEDVYGWGWNKCGQLGLPREQTMESSPTPLFEEDTRIFRISTGRCHSAFLCNGGVLYLCGYNKYAQCGVTVSQLDGALHDDAKCNVFLKNSLKSVSPTLTKVSDVKCGPWSTYITVA